MVLRFSPTDVVFNSSRRRHSKRNIAPEAARIRRYEVFLARLLGIDGFPIVLHADDRPTVCRCCVEAARELADVAFAIVSELARGVIMMNEQPETRTLAAGGPFEHLEVAVGIAESGDRAAANVLVDPDRLAGAVVDKIEVRHFHDHGPAVADFILRLDAGTDDLLGRDAVGLLSKGHG